MKPEKLIDYELGIGYSVENLQCKANAYWMNFKNEIIASGQVNDDGQPIRGNADRSIHRGLEFSLFSQPFDRLVLTANYSFSQNYYEKFIVQGTDENWMVVPIDLSGNTIPLFPNRLGNLRMTFTQSFFRASVHWQSIGRQYLDSHERMERSLPPYSLINLSCEFDLSRWVSFPGLSIGFQIVNAADQDYYASGYYDEWSNANYYFPAAPRSISLKRQSTFNKTKAQNHRMQSIDIFLIVLYLLSLVGIGLRKPKENSAANIESYLLDSRRLTLPAFVATLVSTWYGGILGVGEYSYIFGISNWLVFGVTYYLAALIFALFIAKRARRSQMLTIPQQLEHAYGQGPAHIGALLVFVMTVPAAYVLMLGVLINF